MASKQLGTTRGLWLVSILYAAQGLPLSFLFVVIPLALNDLGWEESAIGGMVGVAMIPWMLKPIWGVVVDRWGSRFWWIVGGQTGAAVALLGSAVVSASGELAGGLMAGAILAGLGCAVQDVATDGMAVANMPEDRRGATNAAMALGMTIGGGLGMAGGGFLYAKLGASVALGGLAGMTCVLTLVVSGLMRGMAVRSQEEMLDVAEILRGLCSNRLFQKGALLMGLIAATGISGGLIALFFTTEVGISEEAVGGFMTSIDTPAALLGNLLAIRWLDGLGRKRAAILAIGMVALVNGGMGIAILAAVHPGPAVAGVFYLLVQMGEAFAAAAVLGLLMDCCGKHSGGAQFATIMACGQAGGAISAWGGGAVLERSGWGSVLVLQGALCVVPMLGVAWIAKGIRAGEAPLAPCA